MGHLKIVIWTGFKEKYTLEKGIAWHEWCESLKKMLVFSFEYVPNHVDIFKNNGESVQ